MPVTDFCRNLLEDFRHRAPPDGGRQRLLRLSPGGQPLPVASGEALHLPGGGLCCRSCLLEAERTLGARQGRLPRASAAHCSPDEFVAAALAQGKDEWNKMVAQAFQPVLIVIVRAGVVRPPVGCVLAPLYRI